METSTFYVNAPLNREEHEALAELARGNGRAKGQELRAIAVAKLSAIGLLNPGGIRIPSKKKGGKRS